MERERHSGAGRSGLAVCLPSWPTYNDHLFITFFSRERIAWNDRQGEREICFQVENAGEHMRFSADDRQYCNIPIALQVVRQQVP